MTYFSRALLLTLALGLAACSTPDHLSDAPDGGSMGVDGGLGAGVDGIDGGALDPNSPAFFSQTVGDRVLFAVDQSTLSPAARSTLQAQSTWLLDNRDYAVTIEGHADEQGTREYNLALGARRASAVQQFLIAQGVSPTRIRTVTYGKERPIEICSEEACYAKNRRAVTVLAAGAGAGV